MSTIPQEPYRWDPAFEAAVVTLVCSNPDVYRRVGCEIDPELLKRESSKWAIKAAHAIFKESGRGPSSTILVIQHLRLWMGDGKITLERIKKIAQLFDDAEDAGLPDAEQVCEQVATILRQRLHDLLTVTAVEEMGRKGDMSKVGQLLERAKRLNAPATATALPLVACAATVRPEKVSWLWAGRIPLGKITIVDGDPGLGKSTLVSADLAARVSTGAPMPDEPEDAWRSPGDVLILSAEDGAGDTIRPRLDAADADVVNVHVVDPAALTLDADGIAALERMVLERGAKLVVIDPLMAFLGGRVDAHRDQDIRRALRPVAAMAEKTGAAVVLVRHLRKTTEGGAVYRGGGSIGIIGAARAGFLVAKDPENPEHRILASTKSNLGPPPPALRFMLENDPRFSVGKVVWLGEADVGADALVAPPTTDDPDEKSARGEACRVLRQILAEGPVAAVDAFREGAKAGVSKRTLERAKHDLGVEARKDGKAWFWWPPEHDGGLGGVGGLPPNTRKNSGESSGGTPPRGRDVGALPGALPEKEEEGRQEHRQPRQPSPRTEKSHSLERDEEGRQHRQHRQASPGMAVPERKRRQTTATKKAPIVLNGHNPHHEVDP